MLGAFLKAVLAVELDFGVSPRSLRWVFLDPPEREEYVDFRLHG